MPVGIQPGAVALIVYTHHLFGAVCGSAGKCDVVNGSLHKIAVGRSLCHLLTAYGDDTLALCLTQLLACQGGYLLLERLLACIEQAFGIVCMEQVDVAIDRLVGAFGLEMAQCFSVGQCYLRVYSCNLL